MEKSVCNGEGRDSISDASDLHALKQHCIKNRHNSVMEITAWGQEHFQKSLCVNAVHCAIHEYRLKLYDAKTKQHVTMIQNTDVLSEPKLI